MTFRSVVLAPVRGTDLSAPPCRCGLPLGPVHRTRRRGGPALIRRCAAGHVATALAPREDGFDSRFTITGALDR